MPDLRVTISGKQSTDTAFRDVTVNISGLETKTKDAIGTFAKLNQVSELVAKAFRAVSAAVTQTVGAASESIDAELKLAVALASTGQEVEKNVQRLGQWAEARQRATVFEDDSTRSMLAMAIQAGVTGDRVEKLVAAAQDASLAFGKDATSALQSFIQAARGSGESVRGFNVYIGDAGTFTQRLDAIIRKAGTGFSVLQGSLPSASFAKLANVFGDVRENLGKIILQTGTFSVVMEGLQRVFGSLSGALGDDLQRKVAQVFDSIVATVLRAVAAIGEAISNLFNNINEGVVRFTLFGKALTSTGQEALYLREKVAELRQALKDVEGAEGEAADSLRAKLRTELQRTSEQVLALERPIKFNAQLWRDWADTIEKRSGALTTGLAGAFAKIGEMFSSKKLLTKAQAQTLALGFHDDLGNALEEQAAEKALATMENVGQAYTDAFARLATSIAGGAGGKAAFKKLGADMRDAFVGQITTQALSPVRAAFGALAVSIGQALQPVGQLVSAILSPIIGVVNTVVTTAIAKLLTLIGVQQLATATGIAGAAAVQGAATGVAGAWGAAAVAASIATLGAATSSAFGAFSAISAGAALTKGLTVAAGIPGADEGGVVYPSGPGHGVPIRVAENRPEIILPLDRALEFIGGGRGDRPSQTVNVYFAPKALELSDREKQRTSRRLSETVAGDLRRLRIGGRSRT